MARKRRGPNEGGVYQRESDGRWVGSITVGRTPQGRQKRRVVYGATKVDVLTKLRELQKQHDAGTLVDPSGLTVEGFLRRWMETAGGMKRETTKARRRVYVDKHIILYLGAVRLNKLGLIHLEGWLADLGRDKRSDWTRHQAATVLGTALNRAVRMKLIPFNPAADLVKPRPREADVEVYTEDEVRRLLAAAVGHRLHALFALAVAIGMRQGEILALHWAEVDFAAATVKVVRTLRERKGGGFTLEPPKSKRNRRTIDLPAAAVDALAAHRRLMLAEGRDVKAGPVFVTRNGTHYTKSNLIRQAHRPLLVASRLPVRKFHAL